MKRHMPMALARAGWQWRVAGAALVCAALPLHAQTIRIQPTPPAASSVVRVAPKPPLTRAELRACLQRMDAIQRRDPALKARVAEDEERARTLQTQSGQIELIKSRLDDRSSEDIIDAYNMAVQNHNLRLNAHKASRKALEADIAQDERERQAYDAACADRQVYEADQAAVMQERAASGAATR